MKYLLSLLVLLSIGAHGATYSINTKIAKIRTVSEFNSVTAARNHVPFKVVGALEGNCTWLYITPEAKDSYSLLLAAKLTDKTIGIQYSDAPSPWHAGTCQVQHLDLE